MQLMASTVIVQQYFTTRRALASGLSLLGVSFGSILVGPLVQLLIDTYGWRGTMIILSGISLQSFVIGAAYWPLTLKKDVDHGCQQMDTLGKSEHSHLHSSPTFEIYRKCCQPFAERLCDFTILKNIGLSTVLVGTFMMSIGTMSYMTHTPSRAVWYGVTRDQAAMLWSYTSIAGLVAKLLVSVVANMACVNRILVYSIGTLLAGITYILNALAVTYGSIAVFVVLLGFIQGEV